MLKLFVAVPIVILATACAPIDPKQEIVKEDKEYVTGSNLPKRDRSGVKVVSPESVERVPQSAPSQGSGAGPR